MEKNEGIVADLHMHSRYSRATSKSLNVENLEKYARIKGIDILGTGDISHEAWLKELKENLKESENEKEKGIFLTKSGFRFVLSGEISLAYTQEKGRRIHLVYLAPNFEVNRQINEFLDKNGRRDYDGRPIFNISCIEFADEMSRISEDIEIIPAHCLLPGEKILCNPHVKPISEVKVDDKVLTHTGTYKKVTNTFVRNYKGKVYRIQPYYFREGINVTSEHPFLAIRTVKNCSDIGGLCKPNSIAKGKHICKKQHYKSYYPEWIPAEKLEVSDVLLYPRPKEMKDIPYVKISEIINKGDFRLKGDYVHTIIGRQDKAIKNIINITPEFCRLIGYYLAEGYITKKTNCLQFSFGRHENQYIEETIRLMKDCFGISLSKKRDRNGIELYFYSNILVKFFEKLFYEKGKKLKAAFKQLPDFMTYLPIQKQVEIFRGWWRGDFGTTVSEILATQMKLICLRLGIVPSFYIYKKEDYNSKIHKIGERRIFSSYDAFVFHNLSFYEDKFNLLEDNAFKKFKTKLQRKHGWIDDNYAYIPIKEIKMNDYRGNVYNLEVEHDNSYITSAATVHNCWTPFFGILGSESGFDSLADAFKDKIDFVHAIETGMSSTPDMNWRIKELNSKAIVSFSDSHSFWPWRMGREATIFRNTDKFSYKELIRQIRENDFIATIETNAAYGKYHYDGHRLCNFSCPPAKTKELNGICPVCGKQLTIGVENRVEKLASFPAGFMPKTAKPFYKVLPLHELIALAKATTLASKKSWQTYNNLIGRFGNEFNILLHAEKSALASALPNDELLAKLIVDNRMGNIKVKPGYDGEYGQLLLKERQEKLV